MRTHADPRAEADGQETAPHPHGHGHHHHGHEHHDHAHLHHGHDHHDHHHGGGMLERLQAAVSKALRARLLGRPGA